MIPILFSPGTTVFTSNGIGRLSDAISCHVVEERNGKYELSMEYPVDGVHFSDIEVSAIIYAVPADGKGPQPFQVYKVERLISGKARIYAEHISYQARHIPVMPFTASIPSDAMYRLKYFSVIENPFTLWTDVSGFGYYVQDVPESMRARLGGQSGSILDVYGGEFEWDHYTIKLHAQRGHDSGVTLRYGKNITDLTQEKNITNTYTAVCPYYKSSDDKDCLVLPEKYILSSNAGNFPYIMAKTVDMTGEFNDNETANVETLRAKTQAYITKNNIGVPAVSIKVSFVALWQTEEYKDIAALERVNLCDTVNVVFEKLGVSATAKVVKTNYNVLIDRYDSIELGETKSQLSSMIANQETDVEQAITGHMQRAIAHATQLITGGLGGYVLLKPNADGQPEEILIMDKPSIEESVQMIRMNKNGIGFSHNGYNGPFHTAWTIDSHFVADFIDTGNLNADLLQVGVIRPLLEGGVKSDNYWNMVSGEFHLSQSVKVGNSTIASVYDVNTGIDDYDITLNQAEVLRKLTNNGAAQGIYLQNGQLYINASYIWTGVISDRAGTNFWNMNTGVFKLSSNTQVGDSTIASKANVNSGISAYDNTLNQAEVLKKLTNNGVSRGIYLTGNQLYINADYIWTGTISDREGKNLWNMVDGTFRLAASTQVGDSTVASVRNVRDGDSATLESAKSDASTKANAALTSAQADATSKAAKALNDAKAYADTVSKTQAKAYVDAYDEVLNQQKVFNKLTNNGAAQGISMVDGNLYINASYMATGVLADKLGHFWLNMDAGVMHMQGANFDSWIKGCVFTGNRFQNAESGQRIMLDETSSLKGYHNTTLHNLINMEQVVSGTHQMTIDADTQLNIRTPHLYVVNASYGERSAKVYETATNTSSQGGKYKRIGSIAKVMPSWPYPTNPYKIKELDLVDVGQQEGAVHCTLPVLLYVEWAEEERIHGMVLTGASAQSDVI